MNNSTNIFESADGKFRVRVAHDYSKRLVGQYFGLISEEFMSVLGFNSHNGEVVSFNKNNAWVEVGSSWGYSSYKHACSDAKALVAEHEKR